MARYRRFVRHALLAAAAAYVLLLCCPQVLFAHVVSYRDLAVYSREPMDGEVFAVLDKVNAALASSPIHSPDVKPRVFLTGSTGFYASLSLLLDQNSFGKGFPALPSSNVFINEADLSRDLVFRKAAANNQRSLSGVIAHEITHLLVRNRYGYVRNLTLPRWKKEGYAEYVAGGSTLSYETGVSLWRKNPEDGSGYRYFKDYMLVKYLLEHDKLTVDELFHRDFDLPELEARVLGGL